MRPFVVAANWKMNKSPREAGEFFNHFLPKIANQPRGREVIFFVPAIDLLTVAERLKSTTVGWGAQNCYFENAGAFTGENSPRVLADIGSTHCLVGHSERRQLFHETDEQTALKVKAVHAVGLTPVLCVGETLGERDAGQTETVITRQLKAGLAMRDASKSLILAYEPVWAIGTGKVATPEQAGEAHRCLRQALLEIGGDAFSQSVPILYGGSVKPDNAADIAQQKEVDGFLVGGASLDPAQFLPLMRIAK